MTLEDQVALEILSITAAASFHRLTAIAVACLRSARMTSADTASKPSSSSIFIIASLRILVAEGFREAEADLAGENPH
jgi:hypothetical protein